MATWTVECAICHMAFEREADVMPGLDAPGFVIEIEEHELHKMPRVPCVGNLVPGIAVGPAHESEEPYPA